MKKFIVAIFSLLYLTSSAGATIYLHYCMGKLVGSSLWYEHNERCGKCGMIKVGKKDTNGCCKDEQKPVKIDKDQEAIQNSIQLAQNSGIAIVPSLIGFGTVILPPLCRENTTYQFRFRKWEQSLFLLNCLFRI